MSHGSLALLKCPACASTLEASDLDFAKGLANCRFCKAAMLLPARPGAPAFRARPEISLPRGITVRRIGSGTEIALRWFRPLAYFLLIFCLGWNGFLVFILSQVFRDGAGPALLILLGHVAAGLYLAYLTMALFLNTTRIRLTNRVLEISHGPLPWPGNASVPRSEVEQLYCKLRVSRSKHGRHEHYSVWATVRGKPRKLVGAGLEKEQALYLEQTIERALGLSDREMPDELPR